MKKNYMDPPFSQSPINGSAGKYRINYDEIAIKVGCSNDLALTRIFKKYMHITPRIYRINANVHQK